MKKTKEEEQMDRISNLPDPIVHHIMSFLKTLDITRISILSKRFFFLWSSFPIIDFDQSTYKFRSPIDFLDHIQNSIRLRKMDTDLPEFRVKLADHGYESNYGIIPAIDCAIDFAIDNGVKLMDLNLGFLKYNLPVLFASKSINVLKLRGFTLDVVKLIELCPSLGSLSLHSCSILKDIKFASKTLKNIELIGCDVKFIKINSPNLYSFVYDGYCEDPKPCEINVLQCQNVKLLSFHNFVNGNNWVEEHVHKLGNLETFIITGCQDIEQIRVWNEKLKKVEIGYCISLVNVEIMAPSLRSFQYNGDDWNKRCHIKFADSKNIREISIKAAAITDNWVEAQLTALCRLESLKLKGCNLLYKIRIFHEILQNLELLNCIKLMEAEIDTPQLSSFKYHGNIIAFKSLVTRSICTATIVMTSWMVRSNETFYEIRKMLSFFGHCKALKLICGSTKELIIPEEVRETVISPLYDLKVLEIYIKPLQKIGTDLVDSLLWLSPLPETVCINSGSSSLQMIMKFAYEMVKEDKKDEYCCIFKPIKCWKHNLTRVEIKSSDLSPTDAAELEYYFLRHAKILKSVRFTK